ncbi:hypothetical protein [Rheinheimera sp. NSM]|uniref:hypothetical protein n=1 Tax=Rheinheimera sp. NSM TaxID=3457884 RepID=UPI004035D931
MYKQLKLFIIASIFTVPFSAYSSDIIDTKITQVLVGPEYGTNVYITISPKAAGVPTCQASSRYDYGFDASTESGKITLSVILASYAAQKNVWIGGKDTCTVNSTIEDLKHVVAK